MPEPWYRRKTYDARPASRTRQWIGEATISNWASIHTYAHYCWRKNCPGKEYSYQPASIFLTKNPPRNRGGFKEVLYQYLNCQGTITSSLIDVNGPVLYQYLNCQGTITVAARLRLVLILYQYLNCQGTITIQAISNSRTTLYQYLNCQGTITPSPSRSGADSLYQYLNCQGTITNCRSGYPILNYTNI